jgi:hypothetical protein
VLPPPFSIVPITLVGSLRQKRVPVKRNASVPPMRVNAASGAVFDSTVQPVTGRLVPVAPYQSSAPPWNVAVLSRESQLSEESPGTDSQFEHRCWPIG